MSEYNNFVCVVCVCLPCMWMYMHVHGNQTDKAVVFCCSLISVEAGSLAECGAHLFAGWLAREL